MNNLPSAVKQLWLLLVIASVSCVGIQTTSSRENQLSKTPDTTANNSAAANTGDVSRDKQTDTKMSSSSAASVSPTARGGIRAVDFKNFTYPWFPNKYLDYSDGKKSVSFKGGMFVKPKRGTGDYEAELDDALYFDLTGDGEEEAVIGLRVSLSNRANVDCTFVYQMNGKKPKLLWLYESGAKDAKGFKNFKVEGNVLVFEEFDTTDSPICCPKSFVRTQFVWNGTIFAKILEQTFPNETGSRLP